MVTAEAHRCSLPSSFKTQTAGETQEVNERNSGTGPVDAKQLKSEGLGKEPNVRAAEEAGAWHSPHSSVIEEGAVPPLQRAHSDLLPMTW